MSQIQKPKKGYKKVKWLFGKEIEIPQEWEIKKLEETGEIISGGTPDSTNKDYWNGAILWAVPTDITKLKVNQIEDTKRKISKQGLDNSSAKLLPKDTILITSRATIGECAISTKSISTNQGFQNIICNEGYDNYFIFYSIKNNHNSLFRVSQGTTFLEVSKNQIKKIIIPIPNTLPEQQKIASMLENLDNLITSTQKLINQTQLLKKALMQKLLTKGIDHKKFKKVKWYFGKEIEIPEEWEVLELSQLSKVRQGLQIPISDRFNESGPNRFQYITVKSIHSNEFNEFIENPSKRVICTENNILFTRTGNTGEIISNIKGVFHNNFFLIDFDKKRLIKDYLVTSLKQHKIQEIIRSLAGTTTIPDLNHGDFFRLKITVPSILEQQKISTILSSINSQIQSQTQYKEKLENLKTSLMQKLLTGEVRVKV